MTEVTLKEVKPEDINLQRWYEHRDQVKELLRQKANGADNADAVIVQMGRLIEQSNTIIDALANDLSGTLKAVGEIQKRESQIGMQSFLTLEVMKKKGLATAEEIHEVYQEIMQAEMKRMQEHYKANQEQEEGFQEPPSETDNVVKFPG